MQVSNDMLSWEQRITHNVGEWLYWFKDGKRTVTLFSFFFFYFNKYERHLSELVFFPLGDQESEQCGGKLGSGRNVGPL